jgi:hypothetical protein
MPGLRTQRPSLGASASEVVRRRVSSRPLDSRKNQLLAALPHDEFERLLLLFYKSRSLLAMSYTMENGAIAEMGLTGNDGVLGIALFMGGGTARS